MSLARGSPARQATVSLTSLATVVVKLLGGLLLGVVPDAVLLPALAALLVLSAVKVWRHELLDADRSRKLS